MIALTERRSIKRLAIVRALHLGDLLLAIPAFRAIRRGFPSAEITLIGLPWAAGFVGRFHHYLDRWREFPGYPGLLEVDPVPGRTEAFLDAERRYRYDLVLQMHGSGKVSNPFALALHGRRTVGFYEGAPPANLSLGAAYPSHLPEVERHLQLTRLLGLNSEDRQLEFPVLCQDKAALDQVLPAVLVRRRPLVGLHVGARPAARRWPPDRFAAVGDALWKEFGAQIVVTAGPGEAPIAQQVLAGMEAPGFSLAEKTDLGSLAAFIQSCDLSVSNDTGPAHVAVALDTPSVTIFGPADRQRWAPLDQKRHPIAYQFVGCSPCPHWDCPIDHRCLRWLEPAQVIDLARRLLTEEGRCAV